MSLSLRTCRAAVKLSKRQCRRDFHASTIYNAAQNFTMPAMSPTMTEGNIASWKVKEGQSFSAGDVLLEIETDKAQMDVEAQDDGIVFKITQSDGSKAVQVGSRIAVIADPGDDLSALSVPEESSSPQSKPSQKAAPEKEEPKAQEEQPQESQAQKESQRSAQSSASTTRPQKYPLYPSVQVLLHQRGLSNADADKIPASGPNGRLLKGDVLAYLGQIEKGYSSEQSARLQKLAHLDLSNIKIATPKPSAAPPAKEAAKAEPLPGPVDTEVAVPISLTAVIATQKRVQDTLGINIPLSVFIGRASELANEDLPLSRRGPSAEDLFNSVLGLDKVVAKSSRGSYFPSVTGLPAQVPKQVLQRRSDAFDELLGLPKKPKSAVVPLLAPAANTAATLNVFSVTAANGEEQRVQAYLDRMKLVLEGEPGRLVL